MGAWLQRTFSSNILLVEFSFPVEFFILHSTNREADKRADGVERKLNEIEAGQSDAQTCWALTGC